MNNFNYPCPCCGFLIFTEPPGSYDICPICFWEDDVSQLRFVKTGGANKFNLIEAQKNYLRDAVCELRLKPYVRPPKESDQRDAEWRLIAEEKNDIEESIKGIQYGNTYPDDRTCLYYWRQNYWRRQ